MSLAGRPHAISAACLPSISPTFTSATSAVRSPTAWMCGTDVTERVASMHPPLPSATPAASSPRSPVLGTRPMEMSARSTAMVSRPFGDSISYSTWSPTARSDRSFASRWMTTPMRSKERATQAATTSSSKGRMRGCRSMMWMRVRPKWANTVAYSQPTTPAPTMTMLSGKRSHDSMWSLVTTTRPSTVTPSSARGREPVATMK